MAGWTWVWVGSGRWWWTGKPGVLQFVGSWRVRHDWVTFTFRPEEVLWEISEVILNWKQNKTNNVRAESSVLGRTCCRLYLGGQHLISSQELLQGGQGRSVYVIAVKRLHEDTSHLGRRWLRVRITNVSMNKFSAFLCMCCKKLSFIKLSPEMI